MRLRPHRRNLVAWSTSAGPVSRSGVPRLTPGARTRHSCRWIRTAGLLTLIGLIRLARAARTRWRPLLAGGVLIPASSPAACKRRSELERDLPDYSSPAQRCDFDLTSMSPWWGRPVFEPPQFASLVDASRRSRKRAG